MKISKQKYSQLQLLRNKKYRYKTGLFILEGERIIKDAIKFGAEISFVAYSEKFLKTSQDEEFLNYLKNRKIEIYEIKEHVLEKVSDLDTSQGIIAVAKMFEYREDDIIRNVRNKNIATVVALDKISDPGNLGAIFRVCDWFKVDLMLISDMSADVFNPKTLRATMGSVFNVPFLQNVDLKSFIEKMKSLEFKIFSTSPAGKIDYHELGRKEKIMLIFGSEAHGISNDLMKLSDGIIRIKRFGKAESLNVAVSVGIILAERAYSIFGLL